MTIALLGVDIGCSTTSSKEEDKTDQNNHRKTANLKKYQIAYF